MRVIPVKVLRDFWGIHPAAEQPLKAWFHEASTAKWLSPTQVKDHYRSASILKNSRVVFNIAGNRYRLVVAVLYEIEVVLIKFIGTHEDYDEIDANTVEQKYGR